MSSNSSFILWLQFIHHINICRKPSFPMNLSFIFTLIVRTVLSLVQTLFVDSVNFIVHICNIKNKQIYQYSLLKETVKWHQLSTSFQVNLEFPSSLLEISSAHSFKCIQRESSGDCWFVTNLLVYYKWSETRSISCTNSIFPLNFIRVCAQYQFKTTSTVDGLR